MSRQRRPSRVSLLARDVCSAQRTENPRVVRSRQPRRSLRPSPGAASPQHEGMHGPEPRPRFIRFIKRLDPLCRIVSRVLRGFRVPRTVWPHCLPFRDGTGLVRLSPDSNEILGRAGEARSRGGDVLDGLIKAGRFSTLGWASLRCVREEGADGICICSGTKKRASFTRTCRENVSGATGDTSSRRSVSSVVGTAGWLESERISNPSRRFTRSRRRAESVVGSGCPLAD